MVVYLHLFSWEQNNFTHLKFLFRFITTPELFGSAEQLQKTTFAGQDKSTHTGNGRERPSTEPRQNLRMESIAYSRSPLWMYPLPSTSKNSKASSAGMSFSAFLGSLSTSLLTSPATDVMPTIPILRPESPNSRVIFYKIKIWNPLNIIITFHLHRDLQLLLLDPLVPQLKPVLVCHAAVLQYHQLNDGHTGLQDIK